MSLMLRFVPAGMVIFEMRVTTHHAKLQKPKLGMSNSASCPRQTV